MPPSRDVTNLLLAWRRGDAAASDELVRVVYDSAHAADATAIEVLALHAALERLAAIDPRQARLVECRYFGGLNIEETAEVLEISPATVKREWVIARAWLRRELVH